MPGTRMARRVMKAMSKTAVALTVAGSDSGGGAGIQADLHTFHALGVFGTCAITCVTAQNPKRVSAVQPIEPSIVSQQMARVFEAFNVRAAKTGMLFDTAIIETVAAEFRKQRNRKLVVDPVMVATSGARLLRKDAIAALTGHLLPLATLVTPNLVEAEVLWRRQIRTLADMREAAQALADRFGVAFLVKGGHLRGATRAVDVLADGRTVREFDAPLVRVGKLHGTGCVYSAAITAHLARGYGLAGSIDRAKQFITRAIRDSIRVGNCRALKL